MTGADGDEGDVNLWKEPEFEASEVAGSFLEESEFKILVPTYRLPYLKEVWPLVKELLKTKELKGDLDLVEKTMSVRTTKKTKDPFAIIRGRDLVKLMSRGVPYFNARKIIEDESTFCEIVNIGGIVRNTARFIKRRQRLIGPNSSTLKAIELLTKCYICVNGQTVACIGPWKGIKKARKIVLDTMNNIHPVYALKTLMIERELASNPEMSSKDWSPYLPHFKKTHQSSKKRPVAAAKGSSSTKGGSSHKSKKSPAIKTGTLKAAAKALAT